MSPSSPSEPRPPLLEIDGLEVCFHGDDEVVKAIDGVSLTVRPGETLGVVGESGSGKSVTAASVLRLVPSPPGELLAGRILLRAPGSPDAVDLARLDPFGAEIRAIRGNQVAMIFQEPMTALSPVHTLGNQIAEAIVLHRGLSWREAMTEAIEALREVGLPSPERQVEAYPHELSGGMRQRALIAMALSCRPSLLIADEPTTALDVTVQAQILRLLRGLQQRHDMAMLLITHDLGVVAKLAHKVAVMYLGKVVESADVGRLFKAPRHPYTRALLRSLPVIGRGERLEPIRGSVPASAARITGCAFAPRCPIATEDCQKEPELRELGPGHHVRCWHAEEVDERERGGEVSHG